jgi:hypothetical protein
MSTVEPPEDSPLQTRPYGPPFPQKENLKSQNRVSLNWMSTLGGQTNNVESWASYPPPSVLPRHPSFSKSASSPGQKGRVVLISNLEHVFRNVHYLYNFLSIYGRIFGLIYVSNRHYAFVEFEIFDDASRCIADINHHEKQGSSLRASVSGRHSSLKAESSENHTNSNKYNQNLFPKGNWVRPLGQPGATCSISRKVAVYAGSSLRGDIPRELSPGWCAEVEARVQKLGHFECPSNKVTSPEGFVGLVFEMKEVTAAIQVLAQLHGERLSGVSLITAFHRENLDKVYFK